MNFWQQLPKSFFILAPMDDVTDVVFRQQIAEIAAPDVFFTEFVAVGALASPGREVTMERLRLAPDQSKPLVAQIYGKEPEQFEAAARDLAGMGFAGIDINFGCPAKKVVAHGSGGGLIGQYDKVADIIAATKAGAGDLPVSVKTRIGLRTIQTEEWTSFLLKQGLAALTIHGRTVREMSKVPAHWDEIAKVPVLRDAIAPKTRIIGNGDVLGRAHGLELTIAHHLDGIMIGRGIFHNVQAFHPQPQSLDPEYQIQLLLRHVELFEQLHSRKPYPTLKRFFKIYINGWPGAADLRARLMDTTTPAQAREVIKLFTATAPTERQFTASNR
jgi:tRNA-dihydrouridine synthase